MGQIVYRANLNAQSFPFVSEYGGNSIIMKQYDQNTIQTAAIQQSNDLDKDLGIPQIYYGHNIMPVAQGIQAIHYDQLVTTYQFNSTMFNEIFLLRDASENKAYFVHGNDGQNYILTQVTSFWVKINSVGATGVNTTTAYVSGETYIYFAGSGCYKYVFASNTLVPVTLNGLNLLTILGITSANGYLIAWSSNAIAWSSTIDPTDFVPSLITGAGGGSVEAARGLITYCLPQLLGFIVYTTDNAVAVIYSGNARFPFTFREIVASGGLNDQSLVAFDGNTSNHYAYTTAGLELISMQGATIVFPELTDFISGSYFEDFDETTNIFTTTSLSSIMLKKVTSISDRYLILSYGITELTHAIVYDSALKRFGKLKITHRDCFEYKLLTPIQTETPKSSIAFLQKDGTVKLLNFSNSLKDSTPVSVLILGKYKFIRTRTIQLDEILLENIKAGDFFSLQVFTSYDGKSVGLISSPTPLDVENKLVRKYGCRVTGENHSLVLKGGFYLVSLELTFNIHGRR